MDKDEIRYKRLENEERKLIQKKNELNEKLAFIQKEKDKIYADKVNVYLKDKHIDFFDLMRELNKKEKRNETI
ncbi:hypothetical protein ACV3RB_13445 [Clostridium perfringens]